MGIPIIIISYNNWKYVENTVNQLLKINSNLEKDLIILDNKSSCEKTINFLQNTKIKVIFNDENRGPWITHWQNPHIYHTLPDKYIITDPDLKYNAKTPSNFVDILSELSEKYKAEKFGLSLDLSDFDKMYQTKSYIFDKYTIYEWEKQECWNNRVLEETDYELYRACVDTTFCLFNKKYYGNQFRIAGDFLAKHIPWYVDNEVYNIFENYELNNKTTHISTIAKTINEYIHSNYIKVNKNDVSFFIKNDIEDPNLNFWKNEYGNYQIEKFEVLDKFLNNNKVFLDIGAWIGTTCIYASRKSKQVFALEPNMEAFKYLDTHCKNNTRNITLINKALFTNNDIDIKFGENKFETICSSSDRRTQIYLENESCDRCYKVKTIKLQNLIEKYNINANNISIIKVDINGAEESILEDLFEIHTQYKVPLYITFYYPWWINKDLNRFSFLSEEAKYNILVKNFLSILFD